MSAALEVLCCAIADVDAQLCARYEKLLSEDEHARWRSFRSKAAATEFLVGRALLRTALAERLHCDAHALVIAKNADGKPFIAAPTTHWHFNLTHSHAWVALALCEGSSVGIDIESYLRRNNLRAIAQRFFSDEENRRLAQCASADWLDYFFAVWTLKEAHAKALGCGLPKILPCSSIAVDLAAHSIQWSLHGIARGAENLASWLYNVDAHTALAVVVHGAAPAPQLSRCVPLDARTALPATLRAQGMQTL